MNRKAELAKYSISDGVQSISYLMVSSSYLSSAQPVCKTLEPFWFFDSYKTCSASALAGIGLIHNLAGPGFPLLGKQMYHKFGDQGATHLLAGLAVLMVPIPSILSRYGESLRERSLWARAHVERAEDEAGRRSEMTFVWRLRSTT
jgi:hypothetical protein